MKKPLLTTLLSAAVLSIGAVAIAVPQSEADTVQELTPIQAEKVGPVELRADKEEGNNGIPENLPAVKSSMKKIVKDTPVATAETEEVEEGTKVQDSPEQKDIEVEYVPDSNMNPDTQKRAIAQYSKDPLAFNTDGLTDLQIDIVRSTAEHSKRDIPAAFLRAMGEQESNITPDAFAPDRNGGTWGTFQINEHEWKLAYGHGFNTDLNNNGTPDEQEWKIQAEYSAIYFDARYDRVMKMREENPDALWVKEMTPLESFAVAHNAGEGGMQKYPNFRTPAVTDKYLENMKTKIPLYTIR